MADEKGTDDIGIEYVDLETNEGEAGDADATGETDAEASVFEWPEGVEVPKRLEGKTAAEVAKEFTSMQQEFGRQSNELGESRALLREAVAVTLQKGEGDTGERTKPAEVTNDDFEADQVGSIKRIVEAVVEPLRKGIADADAKTDLATFVGKHPNYETEHDKPEFQDWVKDSKYRIGLYNKGNKHDYGAADELFSAWNEELAAKKAAKGEQDTTRTQKVRDAGLESGGSGGAKTVGGKKVYRAADIMRLYNTNRDRYNELYPEFEAAEKEGRIK